MFLPQKHFQNVVTTRSPRVLKAKKGIKSIKEQREGNIQI